MRKAFFSVLAIGLLTVCVGDINRTQFAQAKTDEIIDMNEAKLIAEVHIGSSIYLSEGKDECWQWGVSLSEPVPLYDFDDNVSAYYFKIFDKDNNDNGYVVVGANKYAAPIVEFSFKEEFYPYAEYEKMNAEKIIYEGGYDYYISDGNKIYDVSGSGDEKAISEDSLRIIKNDGFVIENHSEEWIEWEEILKEFSDSKSGSNPPSGTYITNPDNYESGYSQKTSAVIPWFTNTYKTELSFPTYSMSCAPLAATNIMLYWYSRNNTTYANLRKNNDSTWSATMARFYVLMHTNSTTGTLLSYLAPAYTQYLQEAGFTPSVQYVSSPSQSAMINEISSYWPFHICVNSHPYYGDHSMAAFGYIRYKYSSGYYSLYIRVADGKSSSANRFVHTATGSTVVRMVKVHFS